MSNGAGMFKRLVSISTQMGRYSAQFCVLLLIVLVTVDVFGRYILGKPTRVADEISGYLLVGITFLAAAYTLQEGMQIKIDILTERLPVKIRRWTSVLVDTIGLFLVVLLLWQSVRLVVDSLVTSSTSSTPLRTPMFIPQLLVPTGLAIFSLEILGRVVDQFRKAAKDGR